MKQILNFELLYPELYKLWKEFLSGSSIIPLRTFVKKLLILSEADQDKVLLLFYINNKRALNDFYTILEGLIDELKSTHGSELERGLELAEKLEFYKQISKKSKHSLRKYLNNIINVCTNVKNVV